ncbi:MAG: heavy metal translocating P-type ATPase [Desulfopila sp.]
MNVSVRHGRKSGEINRAVLRKTKISVKHAMAGRLRVRVESLKRSTERGQWMIERLRQVQSIVDVQTRKATGSMIVLFNPEEITTQQILAEIAAQVISPRQYSSSAPLLSAVGDEGDCRVDGCWSAGSFAVKVRRALWLSGMVLYGLARMWLLRLPLVQTPWSLLGAAAMIGTAPLLKEAVDTSICEKKVTVQPFLAFGSVATIFLGEAFTALQMLWIYNVAEVTEEYVARRSRQAIRDILEVAPANAYVMCEGMEVKTPVADIRPGDIVAVHAGEKLPVDGLVRDGEALVDEASINGRSEPVYHRHGDEVWAGTIISQGVLFVETVKTGESTYLAHIVKMVEDSLANRAPAEQRADQLAARLLKFGLAATLSTLLMTFDPMRALTVLLIMSCPCATVLAASSAVTAAIANAARCSILIKGGLYLERIGSAEVYCFDKTGTLTTEVPEVISVIPRTPTLSAQTVLAMAATAESHNQHPMAQAVLVEAEKRGIACAPHAVCDFKPGRGVLCTVGGDAVILVGNGSFMAEHEVDIRWFTQRATEQRRMGNTVVYVARNGKAQGMLGIANPVRPEARKVLRCLRADGVTGMHLVTGDTDEVARSLLQVFPFDDCRAELLPEEKAARVDSLKNGRPVVMVGDGINDALALSHADIGIAMGAGGAEVALEAADIALVDSDLAGLMKVRNLSHQTMRIIEQNHIFAVSTDLVGVVLGMVGILSPVMAGLIHIMHTGGILLNSSRLLSWEPPVEPMGSLSAGHQKMPARVDGQ